MRSTRRGVDLGDDRVVGHVDLKFDGGLVGQVAHIVQCAVDRGPQVDRLDRQFGDAGVVPGDLQQVVEQSLEPVEFADQQFGGAAQRRVEIPRRGRRSGRRPSGPWSVGCAVRG